LKRLSNPSVGALNGAGLETSVRVELDGEERFPKSRVRGPRFISKEKYFLLKTLGRRFSPFFLEEK